MSGHAAAYRNHDFSTGDPRHANRRARFRLHPGCLSAKFMNMNNVRAEALDAEAKAMVVDLDPDLEAALKEQARRQGIAAEELARNTLRERFLGTATLLPPQDEWERGLRALAKNCGVSLPDSAVSSEGLYE